MQKNSKWIIGIIAGIIVLVAIWVYVRHYNANQQAYTTFTSTDNSFDVQYPRGRQVQLPEASAGGALVASFVTDDESMQTSSNVKPYVNIAKGAVVWKLDDVYAATLEKYKKLFKNVEITSQTKDRINGENARIVAFDGALGGRKMHYIVVFIPHNDTIYTVTAASSPADSAVLGKELDVMLSTWKFTD